MTPDLGPFPWAAYAVDAWQRSVLFLDVLRQRGNAFLERVGPPKVDGPRAARLD